MGPAPPGVHEIAQAVRSGQHTRPSTVLTFFWAIVTTVVGGSVAAAWIGVSHDIPALAVAALSFAAIVVVGISAFVAVTARRDPGALLVGQMSSSDYLEVTIQGSTTGVPG